MHKSAIGIDLPPNEYRAFKTTYSNKITAPLKLPKRRLTAAPSASRTPNRIHAAETPSSPLAIGRLHFSG